MRLRLLADPLPKQDSLNADIPEAPLSGKPSKARAKLPNIRNARPQTAARVTRLHRSMPDTRKDAC